MAILFEESFLRLKNFLKNTDRLRRHQSSFSPYTLHSTPAPEEFDYKNGLGSLNVGVGFPNFVGCEDSEGAANFYQTGQKPCIR